MSAAHTIPGFYGRSEELGWLRGLWDEATRRDELGSFCGGPRMAFILSETGLGKSRLVQALYQQLTTDPVWDLPELNYWPDAFQSPGMQIRVTPDIEKYEPKGPPRFLWLGMRWQPPDARNVEERSCPIPDVREQILSHVKVAQRHQKAWRHALATAAKALRREGVKGGLEQTPDIIELVGKELIPFAGLIVKGVIGSAAFLKERIKRSAPPSQNMEHQMEDAADALLAEMREIFGGLGSGGLVVPTVLWLDDAQWIDATTLKFLRSVWLEAQAKFWPLLIVVTHWEREWNELARLDENERDATLQRYKGKEGVEVRVLTPAPDKNLGAYLRDVLPGLTALQQSLMLEKAAGNFLTLVENVGMLKEEPGYFVGGDATHELSSVGEDEVRTWESERHKRIEQRFRKLGEAIKKTLGWSSRIGLRFLADVVRKFGESRAAGGPVDARTALDLCVDPYAILGTPSILMREFRDRAFHDIAWKYFAKHCTSDHEALSAVLRETLAAWINRSFDADGDLILSPHDTADAATALPTTEMHDLLRMATRELTISKTPDWANMEHVAALRAVIMTVLLDIKVLHTNMREWPALIHNLDWHVVPPKVISEIFMGFSLHNMASLYMDQGRYAAAESLYNLALTIQEKAFGPDHPDLAFVLESMAELYRVTGDSKKLQEVAWRAKRIRRRPSWLDNGS